VIRIQTKNELNVVLMVNVVSHSLMLVLW